jgi:hypothetical protein
MAFPTTPLTKRRITIEPQARQCMEQLGITDEEIVATMNEWESGWVVATDPRTANTLAAFPEAAEVIPAFYEAERAFPEHNLTLVVYYSSHIKSQRGKPSIVSAIVHWVSSNVLREDREPLPEKLQN